MGIKMNRDIHSPTVVPSGETSAPTANGASWDKLSLMELIEKKDNVEAELKALGSVLDSHGVNMNTGLTTFDGYPRDDIDIAQIRTTRARIIRLRNDYKALMNRIEEGLHAHHANLQASGAVDAAMLDSSPATTHAESSSATEIPDVPFCRVGSVADNSPAEEAGLRADDLIKIFGGVSSSGHEEFKMTAEMVADVVKRSEGTAIPVKVQRAQVDLHLRLTPRRNWGGRGLLGCHLLPI